MPYSKGTSGNPGGRPIGSKARPATLSNHARKVVLKQLEARAAAGDNQATDVLATLMLQESASV